VVQAHALLRCFSDENSVLIPAQAKQDATVGLACWRTRFAAITNGAFGDGNLAAFHGGNVGYNLFSEASHDYSLL
jgi:hypothetical protein